MNVLNHCLETVWVRNIRFSAELWQGEWLWVWGGWVIPGLCHLWFWMMLLCPRWTQWDTLESSQVHDCLKNKWQLWLGGLFLDQETLLTMIHALVTSVLDYCNTSYTGLPLKIFRSFNGAECSGQVICASKTSHVTLLLYELLWLPVCFQVEFKLLVLTFNL